MNNTSGTNEIYLVSYINNKYQVEETLAKCKLIKDANAAFKQNRIIMITVN